jgi:protein-tyrosine phosphatase
MQTVLFLCSGNYYRSRFAEIFFNHWAEREGLPWRAASRGFKISANNVGPISPHTIAGLRSRGISLAEPLRFAEVVTAADFDTHDHVIAVKEAEHRSKMQERFPDWAERIEYWHIHDLDCALPDIALVELESQVRALMSRLRENDRKSGNCTPGGESSSEVSPANGPS